MSKLLLQDCNIRDIINSYGVQSRKIGLFLMAPRRNLYISHLFLISLDVTTWSSAPARLLQERHPAQEQRCTPDLKKAEESSRGYENVELTVYHDVQSYLDTTSHYQLSATYEKIDENVSMYFHL